MLVPPDALVSGDVLLYRGQAIISRLIQLFDGSEVSHAAVAVGPSVVEALFEGVVKRDVVVSVQGTDWVKVRRSSAPFDRQELAAVAERFIGERYGYEQLSLLAVLAVARRVPLSASLRGLMRRILDDAADAIVRVAAGGREPLICSELVYRCHQEVAAGSIEILPRAPGARAGVEVARVDPGSLLALVREAKPVSARGARASEEVATLDQLGEQYLREVEGARRAAEAMPVEWLGGDVVDALDRFATAFVESRAGRAANGDALDAREGLAVAAANFVTPGDLARTRSLHDLGTIGT